MQKDKSAYRSAVRVVSVAALLLLVPLVAMQFSEQVVWSPSDFVLAAVLLVGTGLTYEFIARRSGNTAYRAAVGLGVGAALLLVWLNLAVGIIGTEDNPANLLYLGVLSAGGIGAILARFQPNGMARAMFATALTQALVTAIALITGLQQAIESNVAQILGVNWMFVTLFAGSALLFRHAAREQSPAGAGAGG